MAAVPTPRPQVDLPVLARRAAALLAAGVPLTLLLDLAEPAGPRSRALYEQERQSPDWLARAG